MYDSNICVFSCAVCCRWSSTQENLVFFWGEECWPNEYICRSWYFDLHVGVLTLAASMFSIAFLSSVVGWAFLFFNSFFPPHSHNRKSGKTRCVCIVCLWWPAGETRPELKERKGTRWGLYYWACTQHNHAFSGSTVCQPGFLTLMGALLIQTCFFSLVFWCYSSLSVCHRLDSPHYIDVIALFSASLCSLVLFLLLCLQGDQALPLPLALIRSTHLLSLLHSFCFLITLSLSLLCLCVYCVGVH